VLEFSAIRFLISETILPEAHAERSSADMPLSSDRRVLEWRCGRTLKTEHLRALSMIDGLPFHRSSAYADQAKETLDETNLGWRFGACSRGHSGNCKKR
jgi:hypothetical protein